jgi:hypothetical protein
MQSSHLDLNTDITEGQAGEFWEDSENKRSLWWNLVHGKGKYFQLACVMLEGMTLHRVASYIKYAVCLCVCFCVCVCVDMCVLVCLCVFMCVCVDMCFLCACVCVVVFLCVC